MSMTMFFKIVGNKDDDCFWDHELWGMMCERAKKGKDLELEIVVFIPVANGVLELGSAHLTFPEL